MKNSKAARVHMFGVGYDCKDGHTRITKGDNFSIIGGSKETHEKLQEKAIKINEKLKKRGKTLERIGPREFFEILEEIK